MAGFRVCQFKAVIMDVILMIFFILIHAVVGVILLMVGLVFPFKVTACHYPGEDWADCGWDDTDDCMYEEDSEICQQLSNTRLGRVNPVFIIIVLAFLGVRQCDTNVRFLRDRG